MRRRDVLTGLTALSAAPWGGMAWAAARLGVAPTLIEFSPGDGPQVLRVTNTGQDPLTAQVRLFAWRNAGIGEDLTPSSDLVFSPPQFAVPAGGRQVVRLVSRVPPGPAERAYRLVVDQLPIGARAGIVSMAVRMMLPVFVAGQGGPQREPLLQWSGVLDRRTQMVTLRATNPGLRRVRLAALGYEADGRTHLLAAGLVGYVLAGGALTYPFRLDGAPQTIRVYAQSERGPIHADVQLEPR